MSSEEKWIVSKRDNCLTKGNSPVKIYAEEIWEKTGKIFFSERTYHWGSSHMIPEFFPALMAVFPLVQKWLKTSLFTTKSITGSQANASNNSA
jgi:hypothetical protein